MMLRLLSVLLFFLYSAIGFSQENDLYMPLNLKSAYDAGTRFYDGQPGEKYWQNKAEYKIDVAIDFDARTVSGKAVIRYFNESPDTLTMIRIKLAHDLWRKGGQRAYGLPANDIHDGVQVSNIKMNNVDAWAKPPQQGNTFLNLFPKFPIPPGTFADISLEWSYPAPATPRAVPRECVCDSTTWFLAYWYPQIAVYDDLRGWAKIPYNGRQEMYNDFSDYEVNIQVPAGIMVWSTGEWDNPRSLLKSKYYSRFKEAKSSDQVVNIITRDDLNTNAQIFKKRSGLNTFTYKAKGVPDFAFGLSDHYLWDARSVVVDSTTGRRALVAAAYHPDSEDYYEVCDIASRAIGLMSNWLPGYPYPYPAMTVFNGDDGMEFPMMCNDVSTAPRSPIGLTVHESSHTYFPFMMGINEQYYAWMDEGWAAFFDVLVTDSIAGKSLGNLRNYPGPAGTEGDMPPMVPSHELSSAYRVASYNRPQSAYMNLYDLLGYEKFHECMTEYMDRWKGKHPQPFDFFNTWNDVSGQNLNWFWKPWFFEFGYPDLAVEKVETTGEEMIVTVRNEGTMPMAVTGYMEFTDGTKSNFHLKADVWKSGKKTVEIKAPPGKDVVKVVLGSKTIRDKYRENDVWEQ